MWDNSKATARYLRKNQTQAENVFWELVRNRRLEGTKFFRQYPIKFEFEEKKRFFVVDFYCYKIKTIFEIDGEVHEKQKKYDKMREKILESLKYKIVRFSNEEVLSQDEKFLEKLKNLLLR